MIASHCSPAPCATFTSEWDNSLAISIVLLKDPFPTFTSRISDFSPEAIFLDKMEEVINGNIIIAYSDILFESNVVKRLLESDHDISVVVDIDWRGYYVDRKDHPIEEAENVIFNSNNEVVKIGKIVTGKQEVHGEFIGMMKLTNRGAKIFKQNFSSSLFFYISC